MKKLDLRLVRALMALADMACWFVATLLLIGARYDLALTPDQWSYALGYAAVAAVAQLVLGTAFKLYRGAGRIGSYFEVKLLGILVAGIALVVSGAFVLFAPPDAPVGIPLTVPFFALVLMFGIRFLLRAGAGYLTRRERADDQEPVLIYGAGNAGNQLGILLIADPDAPYQVAGFIDDDPLKRNLHLAGSKVVGQREDLVAQAKKLGATSVILAISTADAAFLGTLSDELDDAGIRLLVLPPVKDMVGGEVSLAQVHEFDVADLLGRKEIKTDLAEIAGYLSGKVVLVTGAGGSIGSEIARQVYGFKPKELVCLDRDESALHSVQLSIYGKGLLDTPDMVLCDIRDKEALEAAFEAHQPDVVFHAAALKHLPMLEQYPSEGWKTNVFGSMNVLECAATHGVRHFVNISTDKAADPTSVLGKTKRKAEELTSWFAERNQGTYVSVRFGNVLGSRGSVLHTFSEQIRQGGPVTVVDPDITRFFMTIPEACQLVIQAGAVGEPGDVMVLDMGEPVKIIDVARRLIRKAGKPVEIVFTGLRPGEKMHEVLFSDGEDAASTDHALISRVRVPAVAPSEVKRLAPVAVSPAPVADTSVDSEETLVGASVKAEAPPGAASELAVKAPEGVA